MSDLPGLDAARKTTDEISRNKFKNMGVTYDPSGGEYEDAIDILAPLTDGPVAPDPPAPQPAQPQTSAPVTQSKVPHGPRIKQVMQERGYPWFPDQNVVSIEKMNVDGSANNYGPNVFRDIKLVLDGDGNVIGGPWDATTHPGVYWTTHPMASGGAFIIALGSQACWTPGEYHGKIVWRQAEDSHILGHRDPNCTYERQGAPIVHGDIGVHHHGGYNLRHDNIANAAAGCQVIRLIAEQAEFMQLTMACPRYLADKSGYRLTATVLEAKDILGATATPAEPPIIVTPLPVIANNDFDRCVKLVLQSEGGNDDDPNDRGGRTSRGITQREYDAWRHTHPDLPSDVWQAPQDTIIAIYRRGYWQQMCCDGLPSGVDYAVFDYGVNSGTSRAVKVLQGFIGTGVDGRVGPNTIAAAARVDAAELIKEICDQRLAWLEGLSQWDIYGRGWGARVERVRRDAMAMVSAKPPAPAPAPAPPPQPQPPSKKEPPAVDPVQPAPAPQPAPQPQSSITSEQIRQIEEDLLKRMQQPTTQGMLQKIVGTVLSRSPQIASLAWVILNALQALDQIGTAGILPGGTATPTGQILTGTIFGTGLAGLLNWFKPKGS